VSVGSLSNFAYIMESLEAEWRTVQPPTYFTSVRDAKWPTFPPEATESLTATDVAHSVFLWKDRTKRRGSRQENNVELSPVAKVLIAQVLKDTVDVQRQMALAEADLIHLMEANPARNHVDNPAGPNNWGLFTRQAAEADIEWMMPKDAQSYGIGIVWSLWDVEYRHPLPMG